MYKGLISGSYIGSVLTTDMMPAFCSLTLATASGILGVPCGTALIHPLGRRRMTPLGVESCVWAHTIHYIMHTESRMSPSVDQEIQVPKSSWHLRHWSWRDLSVYLSIHWHHSCDKWYQTFPPLFLHTVNNLFLHTVNNQKLQVVTRPENEARVRVHWA